MKKKRWKSRFWAMLAVLAMVGTMLLEPLTALAEGGNSSDAISVWAEQSDIYVEPFGTVTLEVKTNAPAGTNLAYQWVKAYVDDDEWHATTVEGATGTTLVTEPITRQLFYYCHVYKDDVNISSVSFSVRPDNQLEVTAESASQKVEYGSSATMRVIVTALNTDQITYQWYKNDPNVTYADWHGEIISGATSSTYQIASVTDAGRYGCRVCDQFGTEIEKYFYIEVENHLTVTPAYDYATVTVGESKTITVNVSADDVTGMKYVWAKAVKDPVTGYYQYEDIAGANKKSYVTGAVTEAVTYRCTVTDRFGNEASGYFGISIENHLHVFVPGGDVITADYGTSQTITLNVSADDVTGMTYQWEKGTWNSSTGAYDYSVIEGANSSSYVTGAFTERIQLRYKVTDRFGGWVSGTVTIAPDNHLTVTPQYEIVKASIGESKTLTVSVSADDLTGLTYRWVRSTWDPDSGSYQGTDIAGATKKSYNTGALTGGANYYCYVTDRFGNVASACFSVELENHLTATPASQSYTVEYGTSKTLTVTASADDVTGLTYQWYLKYWKDGGYWVDEIEGANQSSYTIGAVTESVMLQCSVRDLYGNTASCDFSVAPENHFTVTPVYGTEYVDYGTSTTISVNVSADDMTGMTYQWLKNVYYPEDGYYDYVVIDGATTNSVTVDPVTESTTYLCQVTDCYGTIASSYVTMNVANRFQVMPLTSKTEYQKGEKATLRVKVSAKDMSGITYEWSRYRYVFDATGNYRIENEELDGSSDTLVTEKITDSWVYNCKVTDRFGTSVYASFTIKIANHFRYSNGSGYYTYVPKNGTSRMTVKIMADHPEGIRYVWFKDNVVIKDGAENYFDAREKGYYECYAIDSYGNYDLQLFFTSIENHFSAEADGGADKIVKNGGSVTLKVNVQADDKSSLRYEWYKLSDDLNEWGMMSQYAYRSYGGNGASLKLTNVTAQGTYMCTVSDQYGNSKDVTFNVYVGQKPKLTVSANKGTFTDNPYNDRVKILTVPSGQTVKLKVTASGFGSDVKYCWYENGNNGMADYWYEWYPENGTTNTFTFKAVSDEVSRTYQCCVTDGQGRYEWIMIDVVAADTTITYDANGGTGTMPKEDYQSGTMYILPECGFTAPFGKTFAGWDVNGEIHEFDDLVLLYEDTTIKAVWKDAEEVSLKFSYNIEFDNNIALHYAIKKADLKGCSDLKLVIDKEHYDENVATPTIQRYVLENPATLVIGDAEYWHFTFPGICAPEMGNKIEATLGYVKNGVNYVTKKEAYSVAAYAYDRLKNSNSDSYKKILVDMLNYGAAAQYHFGINADYLVNANLTKDQKKLASSWSAVDLSQQVEHVTGLTGATASFNGKNLSFDNKVVLLYGLNFKKFLEGVPSDKTAEKMANVKVKFTYDTGKEKKTQTIPYSKFQSIDGRLAAYCDVIAPAEMGCTVTATIYDGTTPISNTIQYSIEAYAKDRLENTETRESYKDLMRKMVMYGRTVNAHFLQQQSTK